MCIRDSLRSLHVAGITDGHELAPRSTRAIVKPDPEPQAALTRALFPGADDIHLDADMNGVPGLVSRIPAIEVVVVNAHRHEEVGSHLDIEVHQVVRLPPINHPILADVL